MASNLYNNPHGESAFGTLAGFGALMAADYGYSALSGVLPRDAAKATLGNAKYLGAYGELTRATKTTPMTPGIFTARSNIREFDKMGRWWGQRRAVQKTAGLYSSRATNAFFRHRAGWGFAGLAERYKAAERALERMPGIKKGGAPVLRALARGPLGFVSSYMMWGSMIPAAADLGLGIFNEAAAEGRRLRGGTPETVSRGYDMATRQQAFTMRQASLMAMHMSQTGVRAAIGNEASLLH